MVGLSTSRMADAHAVTIARTNDPGVLVRGGVLRNDGMDDAVVEQVERADALLLGQEGCVVNVVVDDGAGSFRWKG